MGVWVLTFILVLKPIFPFIFNHTPWNVGVGCDGGSVPLNFKALYVNYNKEICLLWGKVGRGSPPPPSPNPSHLSSVLPINAHVSVQIEKIYLLHISIFKGVLLTTICIFSFFFLTYITMFYLDPVIKNLNSLKKRGGALALVWFSVYQSYVVIGTLQGNSRCLIFIPWSCTGWPVLAVCVRGR